MNRTIRVWFRDGDVADYTFKVDALDVRQARTLTETLFTTIEEEGRSRFAIAFLRFMPI